MHGDDQREADSSDPLARLARVVLAWEQVPRGSSRSWISLVERDTTTVDRAKGAVMLRYGVNSHVALAMLARWARDAHVTMVDVSRALVDGAVRSGQLPIHQQQVGEWLRARDIDTS